jgi:uncharacterized membrane protein
MTSLAELRVKALELEDKQRKLEKEYDNANRQYTIGLWGILVGIFLVPVFGLGFLLILAGALAAITNRSKRTQLKRSLGELELKPHSIRLDIATSES